MEILKYRENCKYPWKGRWNFCLEFGNIGVISMYYQLRLVFFFFLASSCLGLPAVVLYLFS